MNISIKINGIDNVISRLNNACNIENALLRGGEIVRAEAQANCPKDTGRLANSIVVQSEGGNSVVIGPTAEYGIYVEFGTGSMGNARPCCGMDKGIGIVRARSARPGRLDYSYCQDVR